MSRKKLNLPLVICVLIVCLSQASCGFRLRGMVNISKEFLPIAIVADGVYIQITPVLAETLQGAGLVVVDANLANSVLRLRSERYEKALLTVATSGESQTHSLQYTIQFEIQKRQKTKTGLQPNNDNTNKSKLADGRHKSQNSSLADKDTLNQVVSVTRSFQFEKKAVLSSATEEAIIKKEMLTDAAQQILRRLNYLNTDSLKQGQIRPQANIFSDSQFSLSQ